MKSKVYFINNCEKESVMKLYNALGKRLKGNVAVKVHSGETGNLYGEQHQIGNC